jgi:NCAIR mutase (PurE)-related protein
VERIYDVGVAGIDRLLAYREKLQEARVIIVVAGMEGALASVVGGLVRRPVIAVPTSVGYGAHLSGLTPLFSMLTSCAAGVTVVNIDNGFGAGYAAAIIQQLVKEARDK